MPGAVPSSDAANRSFATPSTKKGGSRVGLTIVGLLFGLLALGGGLLAVLFAIGTLGGPETGQLRVQSVIQGAELWVDGTARGPLTEGRILELPAGAHVVEARSSGNVVATQSVSVRGSALVEVLLVAQAVVGVAGPEQRFQGELATGDVQLNTGELFDTYTFEWPANLNVHVELSSATFDTYVIVKKPDGTQVDNDDSPAMTGTNSALDLVTPAAGTYQVLTTTFRSGEMGPYELVVRTQ
jgi:hypothetical protein